MAKNKYTFERGKSLRGLGKNEMKKKIKLTSKLSDKKCGSTAWRYLPGLFEGNLESSFFHRRSWAQTPHKRFHRPLYQTYTLNQTRTVNMSLRKTGKSKFCINLRSLDGDIEGTAVNIEEGSLRRKQQFNFKAGKHCKTGQHFGCMK